MKQILLLIGFILLCLAGITGIGSWPERITSVGYFQISTNPFGVAIYQEGAHASVQFIGARSFAIQGNVITIPATSEILYGRDDIIFDATKIYTEPTDEQITYLNKQKITSDDRVISAPEIIYLVNPRVPGMLELQGTDMHIDLDQKQIRGSVSRVIVHDVINI